MTNAIRTPETVLITGASSGIGAALAECFAADGATVILAARREKELTEVAGKLVERHGVRVEVIPVDLAAPDGPAALCEEIAGRGLVVDVLVNNAGFGILGPFADSKRPLQMAMIAVNVSAVTELTHRLLPGMLQGGRGGILNVSSVAAYPPGPLMAVYYACKAYVQSFSDALRHELRDSPLTVTSLAPGPVDSEFASRSGIDSLGFFDRNSLPADRVAAAGHRAFRRGKRNCTPGWGNRLGTLATRWMPRALSARIVAGIQGRKLQ
ncbi:SDR family NAD(P)-dependent oxidoreductase [Roseimaritima sediminicola]|uniref:SDR family NAD(P)-dependent oxidoreductase n=1 Tax=Roseimaritima sediminicola TaxID=2662066 RepID=UPI0012983703|nr:SDR family oxidoreductase [Roseimaritima sediminicola]